MSSQQLFEPFIVSERCMQAFYKFTVRHEAFCGFARDVSVLCCGSDQDNDEGGKGRERE